MFVRVHHPEDGGRGNGDGAPSNNGLQQQGVGDASGMPYDSSDFGATSVSEDRQRLLVQIALTPDAGAPRPIDVDRLNILIGLQIMSLLIKAAATAYVALIFYPRLSVSPVTLETWSMIWLCRIVLQNSLDIGVLLCRKHSSRPPTVFFFGQTVIYIFGFAWFLYGTKLLWFDRPSASSETARLWASILWWYQALSFLIPCAMYSMVCLCLPCLILAVVRLQVPYRDQRPTPETVLRSLDVKTYDQLVQRLQQLEQNSGGRGTSNDLSSTGSTVAAAGRRTPPRSIVPGGAAIVENLNAAFGLPGQTPSATATGDWNTSCPICMLDLEGSDQVMIMPCDERHFFHKACVEQWLRNSQVCPICRANVVNIINYREGEP